MVIYCHQFTIDGLSYHKVIVYTKPMKKQYNMLLFVDNIELVFINLLKLILYFIHYRYKNKPIMSNFGLYDPTSIMNADKLHKYQREGWIKLAFYLFSFFYYIIIKKNNR